MRGKIIVNLSPDLDECYALGPYTTFTAEELPTRAAFGQMVYGAKYLHNPLVRSQIVAHFNEFMDLHICLRTVNAIAAAPKTDPNTPNLVGSSAAEISANRNLKLIDCYKRTYTAPQKNVAESEGENDLIARVVGSMGVDKVNPGERVIVLDDTIRSGGTLRAIGKALRESGASEVYGIAVAKDAKFTMGGVDLHKELWQ